MTIVIYLLLLIPATWLALSLLGFDKIEQYDNKDASQMNQQELDEAIATQSQSLQSGMGRIGALMFGGATIESTNHNPIHPSIPDPDAPQGETAWPN